MNKISFIIPAFNEEKILGKALGSILIETKNNPEIEYEIIVVNNASTDNTKNVAATYPNVKIIDEPNKGLVFARAAGAKAATGELLAHVDADCMLPQGWLKTVLKEFSADAGLVALSGPHFFYDTSWITNFLVKIYYWIAYIFYLFNYYILHLGSILQGGNFVVRQSAWKKIEPSSKDFSFWGEDADLCQRLVKVGKVKFTLGLTIFASGRRFKNEGLVKTGGVYALNYFSVLFFKKPATKNYKDIRPI